jgi:hypothetical protein
LVVSKLQHWGGHGLKMDQSSIQEEEEEEEAKGELVCVLS